MLILTDYEGEMKLKIIEDSSLSEGDYITSWMDNLLIFNAEKRCLTQWDLDSIFLVTKTEYQTSEELDFVGPKGHNYI